MFVGRIAAEKNLPILVEAMPHILLQRRMPSWFYVGDFEFKPELEKIAAESSLPSGLFLRALFRARSWAQLMRPVMFLPYLR